MSEATAQPPSFTTSFCVRFQPRAWMFDRIGARGHAHARDGDARRKHIPAPRVGRVERGERRLRGERAEEADDVVAPAADWMPCPTATRAMSRVMAERMILPSIFSHSSRTSRSTSTASSSWRNWFPMRRDGVAHRPCPGASDGKFTHVTSPCATSLFACSWSCGEIEPETYVSARPMGMRCGVSCDAEADDEEDLAGAVVRGLRLSLLEQGLDARAPVVAERREAADRIAQRAEARLAERLVVVAERLVGLAALLVGEPGEHRPEADDGVVLLVQLVPVVLLHDREAPRLRPRAPFRSPSSR